MFGENEFDADLTVVEERDQVDNGHLMIIPRPYLVTSDNYAGGEEGDVVWLALPMETEQALIFGGHLEPEDPDPVAPEPVQPEDPEPVEEPAAPPAEEEEEV
jgi:hypothetical protein